MRIAWCLLVCGAVACGGSGGTSSPDAATSPDAAAPTPDASCQTTACDPAGNACEVGAVQTCDGVASACTATGAHQPSGHVCGAGQTCDGAGHCGCTGFAVGSGTISTGTGTILEAETHVTRTSTGLTAVAWIALHADGTSTIGYRFLPDASCDAPGDLQSPNGEVASDPVLATDHEDNVYVTWVGYKIDTSGNPSDMHVYVAIAPTGATTFGAPIEVTSNVTSNDLFDKPWIAVTDKDTVLVTYAKVSTGGIYAARSIDHGKTWADHVIVENGAFSNLVYPCAPATGDRVFAAYATVQGVALRYSDDDGVTWPGALAVSAPTETAAFDDPTCVATATDVWVSYGLSNDTPSQTQASKLSAIRIAHSADDGASIAARTDAEDRAAAAYAMHPELVLEPGGQLDLVYYAGNADMDANGSFRWAKSTNGGATWAPSQPLFAPILFLQSRASLQWLGDYAGVVYGNGEIVTAETVNLSGSPAASHVAVSAAATN